MNQEQKDLFVRQNAKQILALINPVTKGQIAAIIKAERNEKIYNIIMAILFIAFIVTLFSFFGLMALHDLDLYHGFIECKQYQYIK